MPVVQVEREAVPGKLGGKTAMFAGMPEFRELAEIVKERIEAGQAFEVDLKKPDDAISPGKGTLEGFKRAFRKLLSQKVYSYEIAVRGSLIYIVGTDKPPLLGKQPVKRSRKKAS